MAPLRPAGVGSALVRQAVVLTFQNLRYLFDSCLPILDKGLRLLDKDFMAVLTTNRSALSECALVCPDALGVGVAEIPISMTVFCLGRLRLIGYFARADFAPAFLAIAGSSYPARFMCLKVVKMGAVLILLPCGLQRHR